MLTLGQYLQPSSSHLPVITYITPAQFDDYGAVAMALGFKQVASAPMVRSSYHADIQAKAIISENDNVPGKTSHTSYTS
jgi:lipoic acid synthetase